MGWLPSAELLTFHVDITKLIDMRSYSGDALSIPPEWPRVTALGDERRQRILGRAQGPKVDLLHLTFEASKK